MSARQDASVVVTSMRPRSEGANIRTWIGFKHLMYLAEEAVLEWFRHRGFGPQRLFNDYGLCLELVDSSVQLPALLEIDDEIFAETSVAGNGRFSVRLLAERDGAQCVILRGKTTVALVPARKGTASERLPPDLGVLVAGDDAAPSGDRYHLPSGVSPEERLALANPGSFHWSWQARYFHCHCTDRVHYSAYVRALEEVVERFLEAAGMPIGSTLATRGLIPVVSRVRVQVLDVARMDEVVHTTFIVDDVLKATAFDGRMDCHVKRGAALVPVATARILHGYAFSSGASAGRLAVLDEGILSSLTKAKERS